MKRAVVIAALVCAAPLAIGSFATIASCTDGTTPQCGDPAAKCGPIPGDAAPTGEGGAVDAPSDVAEASTTDAPLDAAEAGDAPDDASDGGSE
jgi:hypothetical protein